MTTSSGKHLEDTSHAHIVSFLYTLITSAKDADDLSIGFDRKSNRRQRELTKNKIKKLDSLLELGSKICLVLPKIKKKATYGLGYIMTLTRNKDDAVSNKAVAIAHTRIKNDRIH